jgi:cysteine desulfurase / selenocysteine lyase
MSTNTTSTSDRVGADSLTSSLAQEEGAQKVESASPFAAGLPDPAALARLANEFFAALPGAGVAAVSSNEVDLHQDDLRVPSGSPAQTAVPDYQREMFPFPVVPNLGSIPVVPQLPSTATTGALTEADFRAIAASLAGVVGLVPQVPTPAFSSATLNPASSFLEGEQAGPWTAAPQFPPAVEMFSFPGVPAIPSSPPTAPPSGSDLAISRSSPTAATASAPGAPISPTAYQTPGNSGDENRTDPYRTDPYRTDPWATAPNFPNEVFSLLRVPGVSAPGVPEREIPEPRVPEKIVSQPSVPMTSASLDSPHSANDSHSIRAIPNAVQSPAIPESAGDLADVGQAAYGNAAPTFPAVTEMFSFPGVPGAQSPPGVPVLPSSVPTRPPTETDLRELSAAFPGASAPAMTPGVPQSAFPSASADTSSAEGTPQQAVSLPKGVESFEFRPDLAPGELGVAKRPLDPRLIRQDFPILQERVHGRQLIWLDNAATTQKPNAVIDRLSYFYQHENSNVHRAAHTLAARATDAYESAREKTRRFLNASSTREIVFVRGTTEGINLVAQAWGRRNVQKDDEVVITWLEHHANIVPWQQLCSEKGARLRVAPVNDRGEVILEEYERLLGPRTRIVSFSQVSNALGTITPAREMVEMAHRHGARVLVDGAQAVSHMRVDVQALDCDFYVFSGHKIFAPTGIGAVYGKLELLDTMPPWHGGGNMIVDVTFEKTTYQTAPGRFEAGTGNIADAVGLGAALDYVEQVGMESISAYEHELLIYSTAGLLTVPGLRLIGTAREKAGVLSFVLDDVRTEDVGAALNQEGIAVRSGHHCAQPILRRMGVESTVRPSLALYNTREEIDALVAALSRLQAGRGHRKV